MLVTGLAVAATLFLGLFIDERTARRHAERQRRAYEELMRDWQALYRRVCAQRDAWRGLCLGEDWIGRWLGREDRRPAVHHRPNRGKGKPN